MDYNQVLADAIKQQNDILNSAGALMPTPAPLNVGPSAVDDTNLRQILSGALSSNFQPNENALNAAKMQMWTAMAQPRMPGQSTAGNITNALNTGVQAIEAARTKARSDALQQASIASAIASQDVTRRTQEANLQALQAKYPMEMSLLQQQIRNMQLEGKIKEANMASELLRNNPQMVLEQVRAGLAQSQATTGNLKAETATEGAKQGYYNAYSGFLERGGAAAKATTPIGDGTFLRVTPGPNGQVFEHIIPGNPNYTEAMAKKELEQEAKANASGFHPFGMGIPSPTPEAIAQRVQERRTGSVRTIPIGANGTPQVSGTSTGAGATTVPSGVVDLTKDVNSLTHPNSSTGRSAKGVIRQGGDAGAAAQPTIGVKPGEYVPPPTSLQDSLRVDPQVQLARDQHALEIRKTELKDAVARKATAQEIATIKKDIAFKQAALNKMVAEIGG